MSYIRCDTDLLEQLHKGKAIKARNRFKTNLGKLNIEFKTVSKDPLKGKNAGNYFDVPVNDWDKLTRFYDKSILNKYKLAQMGSTKNELTMDTSSAVIEWSKNNDKNQPMDIDESFNVY